MRVARYAARAHPARALRPSLAITLGAAGSQRGRGCARAVPHGRNAGVATVSVARRALRDAPVRLVTRAAARVSSSACTPLTGAYLDVWHCDAAGAYSDVAGGGNGNAAGRKFLRGYQITDA